MRLKPSAIQVPRDNSPNSHPTRAPDITDMKMSMQIFGKISNMFAISKKSASNPVTGLSLKVNFIWTSISWHACH
jgi:hypothetical protein